MPSNSPALWLQFQPGAENLRAVNLRAVAPTERMRPHAQVQVFQMKFVFLCFIQPDTSAILSFHHAVNVTVTSEIVCAMFFFTLSLQNPVCIVHPQLISIGC